MALIRVPIGADGPVIDLGIWLARALAHASVAQGRTVPPPQTIRALIEPERTGPRSTPMPWP